MKTVDKSKSKMLWKDYRRTKNDESLQALVEHYFPFVQMLAVKLAERFNWQTQPDELASFGVDGLYKSIKAYNSKRGVTFEAYSNRRIKGSMIDGLRRVDTVPRANRIAAEQFEKHKQGVQNHLGHRISDSDFVSIIGMSESDFNRNHRKFQAIQATSIDCHIINDEVDDIKQDSNINLTDKNKQSPTSQMHKREFFKKLIGKDFSPLERRIVYLYYYKDKTMDSISQIIGLSESRVSQMHKKILDRMKKKVYQNTSYFDESILAFVSK